MKKINLIICFFCLISNAVFADMEDDPIVPLVQVDQFERRTTDGNHFFVWEADTWIGKDLHKLWIKTEGERVDGKVESAELQLLYSKAVDTFWDMQFGIKSDFKPEPNRNWGVIAAKGLTPYLFEVDASLFIGSAGLGVRLEVEYEYLLTQKLILSPEIEINIFSKDDSEVGIGKGLSDVELGLRLSYEIKREFAPYLGINWEKKYGNTGDFAHNEGEDIEDFQLVVGVSFWF